MLTLSFLKSVLSGQLKGVTNDNSQIIESAGGYDGIISLIQTKGVSPVVVLENSEVGEFSFRPGGFLKASQSVWVMKMVGRDGDRRKTQDECFTLMKNILKLLNGHRYDPELKEWEMDRIPWGVRNAGANFTGYEFTLYFSEDTDLSYNG